jgi:hypothetical protein
MPGHGRRPGATEYAPTGASTGDVLTVQADGTVEYEPPPGAGGGEANTASNEGGGDAEIFITKTSVNLEFRTISGTGGIVVSEAGDVVEIDGSGISGGSGGLTLLEQHTASSSATLDFTSWYSSTYDQYQIELLNLIPATDLVNLYLRMSTNGGSSYDAGANYNWTNWAWRSAASGAFGANAATQIILDPTSSVGVKNTATNGLCGTLRLYSPGSTAVHKQVVGQVSSLDSVSFLGGTPTGIYLSTTAVNAFRFLFSSGNIASGIVRVYGIAK